MQAVLSFSILVWAIGLVVGFWVIYFGNGLAKVKSVHKVDWREFGLPNLGFWTRNWILWPVGLVIWLRQGQPPRSLAVVLRDGVEVREFVRPTDFEVIDGVATSR